MCKAHLDLTDMSSEVIKVCFPMYVTMCWITQVTERKQETGLCNIQLM